MKSAPTVGIDPGGRWTGIVARLAGVVISAEVVTRAGEGRMPDAAYAHQVVDAASRHIQTAREHGEPIVAVEGLVPPSPHMGVISVTGLIGAAMVFGAVITAIPDAVVVAPGGNGSSPVASYPKEIKLRAPLGGPSKHARSAWDVAGKARFGNAYAIKEKGKRHG